MDNQNFFPRVLILGASFDSITGYGITLSNLFRGWPKDRLAVVADLKVYPNVEICNQYYRLAADEYYYIWPLSFIKHRRESGGVDVELETSGSSYSQEINNIWQRKTGHIRKQDLIWKMIYSIDDIVGGDRAMRRIRLSPRLFEWIKRFCPDLIYTQADCLVNISLINQLVETFHIPFVIHMMDDWPATLYADKLLAPYLRWRLNKDFLDLLDRSSVFMGISQKMCEAYQQRYKRSCLSFHNPLELDSWINFTKRDWNTSTPFRLFYAGRIGLANKRSLEDVCNAVAELHSEGKQIRLDLHTPDYHSYMGRAYQRLGCVYVNPPIPYKDIPAAMVNADTLILPLDFDPISIRFARYSMPTKTSEYMASGTPILVYASDKMAVSDYAQQERWGCVVAKRDPIALKQAIVDMMKDQPFRERLGQRARELAIQNHDSKKVREAFRLVLANATQKSKK